MSAQPVEMNKDADLLAILTIRRFFLDNDHMVMMSDQTL
jgi:hypothetical protein